MAGVPNVERGTKGHSGHAAPHRGPLGVGKAQVSEKPFNRICEEAKSSYFKSEVKDGPTFHDKESLEVAISLYFFDGRRGGSALYWGC